MNLRTLRKEPFTTALTAASESRTSAFCAHARAKPVLLFASALGALESAFHKQTPDARAMERLS